MFFKPLLGIVQCKKIFQNIFNTQQWPPKLLSQLYMYTHSPKQFSHLFLKFGSYCSDIFAKIKMF